jgi:hypothetical protein
VIPAGAVVVYDGVAGSTTLQSLGGAGGLALSGGTLSVGSSVSLGGYNQSGGAFSGSGGLSVNGSFSQSAGSMNLAGPLIITQATGPLALGSVQAQSISLTANNGNISQSGALSTGALVTKSAGATTLDNAGNKFASLDATITGAGDFTFRNSGVLELKSLTVANGNATLVNTGGVSSTGSIVVKGKYSSTTNSPLTVGAGGITALGDIELIATNLTSAGNIVLNGNVTSESGAIAITAASDLVQNSTVTAALGLTTTAGGAITFGPNAKSNGNPVKYSANGLVLFPPGVGPGTQSAVAASAQVDFVATFLDKFERAIAAQNVAITETPQERRDKEKKETGLAVEGQSCTP